MFCHASQALPVQIYSDCHTVPLQEPHLCLPTHPLHEAPAPHPFTQKACLFIGFTLTHSSPRLKVLPHLQDGPVARNLGRLMPSVSTWADSPFLGILQVTHSPR